MKKIENMDELLPAALKMLIEENDGVVSTTRIQRRFNIGYPRAARIVDQMEFMEVITDKNPRNVIVSLEDVEEALQDEYKFKTDTPAQSIKKSMDYYYQRQEWKKDDVSKLNLEQIALYNQDNEELDNFPKKEICEMLKESVSGENFPINIDYPDLKKFLLKNDYKIHFVRMPLDSEINSKELNIEKNNFSISILEIHLGTDFPQVVEIASKLNEVVGKGCLAMRVVEDTKEPDIVILY